MKKTRLILALALCFAAVLGAVGCENIATTATTTTIGSDTTTTVSPETTITVGPSTTTTVAPSTTTTTKPKAAPSTTTTTAPAMGVLGAPTPKNKLLKGSYTWDVDLDIDGAGADADLEYRIVDELMHYLEPRNGAGLARIAGKTFAAVSRSDLQAAVYTGNPLSTTDEHDPNTVDVGAVIALRTNTGQYAKIEVTGFEAVTLSDGSVYPRCNIRLRYVLYPR